LPENFNFLSFSSHLCVSLDKNQRNEIFDDDFVLVRWLKQILREISVHLQILSFFSKLEISIAKEDLIYFGDFVTDLPIPMTYIVLFPLVETYLKVGTDYNIDEPKLREIYHLEFEHRNRVMKSMSHYSQGLNHLRRNDTDNASLSFWFAMEVLAEPKKDIGKRVTSFIIEYSDKVDVTNLNLWENALTTLYTGYRCPLVHSCKQTSYSANIADMKSNDYIKGAVDNKGKFNPNGVTAGLLWVERTVYNVICNYISKVVQSKEKVHVHDAKLEDDFVVNFSVQSYLQPCHNYRDSEIKIGDNIYLDDFPGGSLDRSYKEEEGESK